MTQLRSEILMQSKPYRSYSNTFHTHCITCSSTAYNLWHKLMKFYHFRCVTCKCSTECDAVVPKPWCPWCHLLKGPRSPLKPVSWLSPGHPPPAVPSPAGSQLAGLLTHSLSRPFHSQLFSFAIGLIKGCMFQATCLNLLNYSRLGLRTNCEHLL